MINYRKYANELAERVTRLVATDCRNIAKKTVRKDKLYLTNSIDVAKVSAKHYKVYSSEEHALAQEYGRPDLNGYGFTPYMRPAAIKAVKKVPQRTAESVQGAMLAAKI